LADIENRNVMPNLHKLYSLAVIYHLDPLEIADWYEAPLKETIWDEHPFPPDVEDGRTGGDGRRISISPGAEGRQLLGSRPRLRAVVPG